MVFGFDPRKLVKDQQEEEEKKVKDVLLTQERLDLLKEEKEAALRKRSNIRDALDSADKAVREYKYLGFFVIPSGQLSGRISDLELRALYALAQLRKKLFTSNLRQAVALIFPDF